MYLFILFWFISQSKSIIFFATEHYEIKLLEYYMEKGEVELANNYALSIVEKYRKNSELV